MKIISDEYKNLNNFKNKFFNNNPFPHVVLDNFLDHNYFEKLKKFLISDNYYKAGKNFNSDVELNKSISLNEALPQKISDNVKSTYWSYTVRYLGEEKYGVTWEKFYQMFTENGGDGFYGCLALNTDETVMVKKPFLGNVYKKFFKDSGLLISGIEVLLDCSLDSTIISLILSVLISLTIVLSAKIGINFCTPSSVPF